MSLKTIPKSLHVPARFASLLTEVVTMRIPTAHSLPKKVALLSCLAVQSSHVQIVAFLRRKVMATSALRPTLSHR